MRKMTFGLVISAVTACAALSLTGCGQEQVKEVARGVDQGVNAGRGTACATVLRLRKELMDPGLSADRLPAIKAEFAEAAGQTSDAELKKALNDAAAAIGALKPAGAEPVTVVTQAASLQDALGRVSSRCAAITG
ncbi:hypothetical protein [Bailinhaonella thermotolerans]|uniref:Lipoprotein n=1 Tax=Bailinhaonella thermotolerans TaxID=1070861 RepID=A0A3A4ACL2_9ACTN|nr:hypothetical protein [Bailinhaonella thermotolerans]RJL23293.1 hypothetical protein D5H75_33575 [Bailinhaonella thermotolerans]